MGKKKEKREKQEQEKEKKKKQEGCDLTQPVIGMTRKLCTDEGYKWIPMGYEKNAFLQKGWVWDKNSDGKYKLSGTQACCIEVSEDGQECHLFSNDDENNCKKCAGDAQWMYIFRFHQENRW